MRKRLLSILLLCCMVLTLLPTAAFAADDVAIDETNFPDEGFRQYVKDKFDKDDNDFLSAEEIAAVKDILVTNTSITSIEGIEHFTALKELTVGIPELTTLDLSKNTELEFLRCETAKLTSLDTSHNKKLRFLKCDEISTLTTLNVSGNAELKTLYCKRNALTALDLTNNLALEKLECGGNEFTTLDLSRNTELKYFGCFNSKLSSLDLTKNTNLEELYFCGNNVSTIDVSKNTKLKFLHLFSNQLITLDTSKNSNLQRLWVYTNPLTSMNLGDSGSAIPEVKFDNKPYPIEVSTATKTFDLSTLPVGFDVSKASNWQGGTVSETTLTVHEGVENVTYTYDCGERQATYGTPAVTEKLMMPCTLKINWENAPDALTGTVHIIGELKYGKKIYFDVDNSNESGGLRCKWYREGEMTPLSDVIEYELVEADIGKKITCVVSGTTKTGTIETTVGPVEKADGPAAPVISLRTKTDTEILVTENSAWEYSTDNGNSWQRSCHFKDLSPGTEYTIIARVRETATHKPSGNSAPLTVTTMHMDISGELKDKLRAVASAYEGEYDGKEHEAVIVDTTNLPTGWTIAGYTTDGGKSFGNSIPKIKDAGTLNVGVKFVHPDYLMNITYYYTAEITPKPVTAGMIADIPSQHYTGHPIYPTPEIKDGNTPLVKDKDFTYSYDTNTSPKQGGKVIINGMGNYKSTAFKTFTIVSTITEDDLAGLNIPANLVTVKCQTTGDSKAYGRIPGGFDLSNATPYMENGVLKAIVKLNLPAYKDKYDADTKKTHERAGLGSTSTPAFTLKYVNDKWELDGTFPNVIILVKCDGQHPQTPPYPTEENVSGLGDQIVAVLCNNVPAGQQSGKYYGLIGGGFTSTAPTLNADKVYESTITLIPSAYCNQFSGDTGIMHKVLSAQTTDGLKFVVKYDSAKKMWKPAEGVKQMAIWVTCEKHETDTPVPTEFTITFNGNGGTPSVGSMRTTNQKLTSLPTATHSGRYSFDGWYTAASGGTKITTATVFYENTTVHAHWTYIGGGGGGYNPPVTYYTLRFETGGGSDIPSVREAYNTYIDLTKYVPTWRGHTFIGWYTERSLMNKVSGVYLTKDMTVYAGWRVDENPGTGANPFTDVSEKDWFYGDVMFVYENGLMLGTSKTLFSPHGTATRGMMATILWRMEGSPVPKGKNSFTDVEAEKWYADAITWTAENGIFAGYGKDKFGPDDPITREQLAAIFYRYADYKGYDLTVKGNLDKFKDADKITDYAKTAMQWAVGSGLMKGKSGNLLDPQGTATRAEIAAMLHRFIEKYELVQGKAPGGLMGWIDPKRLKSQRPATAAR